MFPPSWQDGTERPIHRPAEPEDRQDCDSGNKQCHTINDLRVIDETCHICFLRATSKGKAHDESLTDLEGSTLPRGSDLYQDRGFQGHACEGIMIGNPRKNPVLWNSSHWRKRPIVLSHPSTSLSNTRLAG